jgi:hypothetical protein
MQEILLNLNGCLFEVGAMDVAGVQWLVPIIIRVGPGLI